MINKTDFEWEIVVSNKKFGIYKILLIFNNYPLNHPALKLLESSFKLNNKPKIDIQSDKTIKM